LIYGSSNPAIRTSIDNQGKVRLANPNPLLKPVFWVIQNPFLNEKAIDVNLSLVDIIRTAYGVTPEFRSQPPVSTTKEIKEAETTLEPEVMTVAERKQAEYTHEYEALLFSELSPKKKDSTLERLLSIMEGETTYAKTPKIEISQDTASAPLLEVASVGAPEGRAKHRRAWDSRYNKILGI
jgi:hypothetical protein